MPVLFSYGSLQRPDIQLSTFGRLLDGHPDALVGYEAGQSGPHANAVFNGRSASRVPGTAFDVTDAELGAADRYELADNYARVAVVLASGTHAWVYTAGPTRAGA